MLNSAHAVPFIALIAALAVLTVSSMLKCIDPKAQNESGDRVLRTRAKLYYGIMATALTVFVGSMLTLMFMA